MPIFGAAQPQPQYQQPTYQQPTYQQPQYQQPTYQPPVYQATYGADPYANESPAIPICALVFSLLFALVGLILGIVGIAKSQKPSNKTMSIIATVIAALNMFVGFFLYL